MLWIFASRMQCAHSRSTTDAVIIAVVYLTAAFMYFVAVFLVFCLYIHSDNAGLGNYLSRPSNRGKVAFLHVDSN